MQAHCMKCRTKRKMQDAKSITMKNGRPATQGICPVCGTKMFRTGRRLGPDTHSIGISAGLDISIAGISSLLVIYHT